MSSSTKKVILPVVLAALQLCAMAQNHPAERPHITGIDHVTFYTTAPDGVRKLYADTLGLAPADPIESGGAIRYMVGQQWVGYTTAPDPSPTEHMDLRLTGVMNHISLGVADMKKAQALMESHGWKPHGDEQAEIGKDGKWQLDVFDPDLTRVELMEFKPVQKPCCSDFTGPHPTE